MSTRRVRTAIDGTERSALAGAVAREWGEPALRGTYLMLANTAVTALLGIAFWVVAARLLPVADVGIGMASVAMITTIANLGQLNLYQSAGVLLAGAGSAARRLQARMLGLVAVCTAAIGVATVIVGVPLGWFDSIPLAPPLVIACAIAWSWFAVKDGLLVATGRYALLPVLNGTYGVLKLGVLALTAAGAAAAIVWATFLPVLVIMPVAAWLLLRRPRAVASTATPPPASAPASTAASSLHRLDLRFVATDYAGFVVLQLCTTLLPFVVLMLAGPTGAGVFATAWLIVVVLDTIAHNAGVPLASEAARAPARAAELGTMMQRRAVVLVVAAAVVVIVGAEPLLSLFGSAYASAGAPVLRLFALASVVRAYVVVSLALLRAAKRTRAVLATEATHAAMVLGLATALVSGSGAWGMALAWLTAQAVTAAMVLALRRDAPQGGRRPGSQGAR